MTQAPSVVEQRPEVGLDELYPRILRYVRSVVRDPADAQDVTQETFMRAHSRRGTLRDPDSVVPWLYSIATHACLDRLRERARQAARVSGIAPEALPAVDPAGSAQLRVEQAEMSACIQGYLGELSDSYRAVLLLHDVHSLTCPQIADLLGDSTGAVKIRCTGRVSGSAAPCGRRARSRATSTARSCASPTRLRSRIAAYPHGTLRRLTDEQANGGHHEQVDTDPDRRGRGRRGRGCRPQARSQGARGMHGALRTGMLRGCVRAGAARVSSAAERRYRTTGRRRGANVRGHSDAPSRSVADAAPRFGR